LQKAKASSTADLPAENEGSQLFSFDDGGSFNPFL
jgi:hypothetical protein